MTEAKQGYFDEIFLVIMTLDFCYYSIKRDICYTEYRVIMRVLLEQMLNVYV